MPVVDITPVEDYVDRYGLLVKREDMSCLPPGPPFSKTRGVLAHIAKRPERVIGVLDTYHSQAGHAVAEACSLLGKDCVNYWPKRKAKVDDVLAPQQRAAQELGAEIVALQAGRSAILYHQARKDLEQRYPGAYMMPNALKLPEMVSETAWEVQLTLSRIGCPDIFLVSASSGTIAAGVISGIQKTIGKRVTVIIHQGYHRPAISFIDYVNKCSGGPFDRINIELVDEAYSYSDMARPGETPPWPCNPYYDLKAFRWWVARGRRVYRKALFWNIG